jgi:hypothetical protein
MITSHIVSSNGSLGTAVSELKLIRSSQQGDQDAFGCLYETYLDRIHLWIDHIRNCSQACETAECYPRSADAETQKIGYDPSVQREATSEQGICLILQSEVLQLVTVN